MEAIIDIAGILVLSLTTFAALTFAVWCAAEFAVRRLKIVWWVVLYGYHGKQFRQWCRDQRDSLPEKHQNALELAEQEAGSGP